MIWDKVRREAMLSVKAIATFFGACDALPYVQLNVVHSEEEHMNDRKFVHDDGTVWCKCHGWRASDGY